jgi:hypothetical protein
MVNLSVFVETIRRLVVIQFLHTSLSFPTKFPFFFQTKGTRKLLIKIKHVRRWNLFEYKGSNLMQQGKRNREIPVLSFADSLGNWGEFSL